MSKGSILVMLAITAGVAWWWQSHVEDVQLKERKIQERKEFELRRVSTDDPLLDLGGCMANHATDLAQMVVAQAIYSTDRHLHMSQEEIDNYNDTRDVLYEQCSNEYRKKIIDKYGVFTDGNLNYYFVKTMREDPQVMNYVAMFSSSHEARKSIYVK
ncbi:hypothetical protein [Uliginosibacterium gangwonense]|uniref:hypothetical protein n=1 Tax=Uliginosibacterium gangwonense TaxID=392736 RepID=UPI0003804448|nr:hypothetical protein [Uliginosibacterium gangwonense]